MIGFERFPLPARKTVFQGIAEKNDAFQDERCGFQTKRFKKCQKSSKKVLTEGRDCDIIIELSARATKPSGQRMILENDTESRRTRTAIFTSRS